MDTLIFQFQYIVSVLNAAGSHGHLMRFQMRGQPCGVFNIRIKGAQIAVVYADQFCACAGSDFQIGLIVGSVDGQWVSGQALFSFEAVDELEPANGWGVIMAQGDRMVFELMFHLGDHFTFECEREKP